MQRDVLSSGPNFHHDDLLPRGGTIGRYVVIGLLGRGGMGNVYAAYDPELDRKVAVKLVRTQRDSRLNVSEGRARLLREAQAIAKLSHPNVVVIYDVGTFEDSVFIAMEFIDGNTVGYWREHAKRSWQEILAVYLAAGRGLAAAHQAGMVHRDFKPENVMVTRSGEVRVMDFGLARLSLGANTAASTAGTRWAARTAAAAAAGLDPDSTIPLGPAKPENDAGPISESVASSRGLDSRLTETGVLLGTPAYMAPEQFGGMPTDARADQFSYCVALYEGLYGERPFAGKTVAQLITSVQTGDPSDPPADSKVPAWLRRTILRGLHRDPAARYASMEELIAALSHDPAAARRRRLTVAGAVVAAGALVAAGAMTWRASQSGAKMCATGAQKLAGVWEGGEAGDSARKLSIQKAFSATDVSYAAPTFSRVRQILDRYVDAWTRMYSDTCQATHVRGEQSAAVLDLRMACLSERLGRVKALTDLFAQATPTIVENAVGAASELPALDRCADVKLLRSITPVPEDPAVRARVEVLQKDLAHVKALGDSGQCAAAAAAGRKLILDSKAIGYPPLEAASLNALGRFGGECMSVDESVRTHRDAILAAAASHDDEAAVEAMISLAYIQAERTSDIAQAHDWSDLGEATLRGMNGTHATLKAWSLLALGRIESKEGKQTDALSSFQRAQVLIERAQGSDNPNVAKVVMDIGVVLGEMGHLDEALASFHDAEGLATKVLGREHPLVALCLANAGATLNRLHRYEEAPIPLNRSIAIWRRAGSSSFYVAWALTSLGTATLGQGRTADARQPLEEALRLVTDNRAPYLPSTRFSLARALWLYPSERHRAVELARMARAGSQPPSDMAPDTNEIDAWLRDHLVP
jgi:serine/threonine protein kinase/tetratricopeptide (TPR) repeat protein